MRTDRRRAATAVLAMAVLAVPAGCSGGAGGHGGGGTAKKPAGPAVTVGAPANGAKDVPTSTPIAVSVKGGTLGTVTLTGTKGPVGVAPDPAGGGDWLPAEQLDYATDYTISVTAKGKDGKDSTARSTFTTMASPGADHEIRVSSQIGDNQTYGVAMPLVVNFDKDVPENQRAAVQKRMFVQSTPSVVGTWHWWSGHEVHFRPKEYWPTGTALGVRLALGGLPLGDGSYLRNDLTMRAAIVPNKLEIAIDDSTHQATVKKDGAVLRTIPVSLGAAASKTSSGTSVIMTRDQSMIFDSSTFGRPADAPGGYRETVYWDMRITWDGQFIHAAPWSVGSQGQTDVSNGCVNMSTENAQWLFGLTHIGDPVTVTNTGAQLPAGDGWTDFNMSWDEFVKGSAVQGDQGTSTQPVPSASPSGK